MKEIALSFTISLWDTTTVDSKDLFSSIFRIIDTLSAMTSEPSTGMSGSSDSSDSASVTSLNSSKHI